ncbi:uncharacterized protein LOC134846217 isoform X2 [Symsagittifera roscoffensis]|uniref:uncharacterized protein LOC134846217 isoform X2 n=1 Tax=Symsagittifera roscoffensis TaxID=84072 RepID=UPI00307B3550
MSGSKIVLHASEACSDSSPRGKGLGGGSRNVTLRVDEYDMSKMEQKLKLEIAEIDRRLEKCNFPHGMNNSTKAKPRRSTLSNDPRELRQFQSRTKVEDEPVMFKKDRPQPKPKTRFLSKDMKELNEIEKYSGKNRNLLGVVPITAPVESKSSPRPKTSTLTNDIGERKNREVRERSRSRCKSTGGSPVGSIDTLADDVFDSTQSGGGNNPITGEGSNHPRQSRSSSAARRRHFSNNPVEMRQIEQHSNASNGNNDQMNGSSTSPRQLEPFYLRSRAATPRGKRNTLTHNFNELRNAQKKEGGKNVTDDEFSLGFSRDKPKATALRTAMISKGNKSSNGTADDSGGSGENMCILPSKSCPGTPSAKRKVTLSKNPGEMQKIQTKYDLEQWAGGHSVVLSNRVSNGQKANTRPLGFSNENDLRRTQRKSGESDSLSQIFGLPQRQTPAINGNHKGEINASEGGLQFGGSGGGAPIRDKESGMILTGVGGRFQKDYFKINDEAALKQKVQKQQQDREDMKKMIEDNSSRRKSERSEEDKVPSEDLVDKIRKLDDSRNRSRSRNTSDVTRVKMDIRYPSDTSAKDYHENLRRQLEEHDTQIQNHYKQFNQGHTETTVDLMEKRRDRSRSTRRLKMGSPMGQPAQNERSISSQYDKNTHKLSTPFAVED